MLCSVLLLAFLFGTSDKARAWRSELYPEGWAPPGAAARFENDKIIQDFSYAGYRRGYNRHGFVFATMETSGNVIHGGLAERTGFDAVAGGTGGSGSENHMWLSPSNLVDGLRIDREFFGAFYRGTTGASSNQGITAVHSVFWNLEGLSYYGGREYILNTQQARYGYAIGTRGPAPGVSTAGLDVFSSQAHRMDPLDHVEGVGEGATLEPASLYLDQRARRLEAPGPTGTPDGGTTGGREDAAAPTGPERDGGAHLDGRAPGGPGEGPGATGEGGCSVGMAGPSPRTPVWLLLAAAGGLGRRRRRRRSWETLGFGPWRVR